MKICKTSILIMLLIKMTSVYSQKTDYIYQSMADYIQNQADTTNRIILEKRTRGQIYMSGGNDYKIYSAKKELSKSIKKQVWAIQKNDSLFLNCYHFKLGFWYAYAEKINDNLFFTAAITMDQEQRQEMAIAGMIGGPIAGGLAGGDLALKRFYYVLNLKTGQMQYLSKTMMLDLIKSFPELAESYKQEKEPEEIETLRGYLSEIKIRNTVVR